MRRLVAISLLVLALVVGCGSENGDEPARPADTGPAETGQRSDYGY